MRLVTISAAAFCFGVFVGSRLVNHLWEREQMPRLEAAVEISNASVDLVSYMHKGFTEGVDDVEDFERTVYEKATFIQMLTEL